MDTIKTLTPELLVNSSEEILQILNDDSIWKQIPLISNMDNFDKLKEMQLVRFRGLIQDMMDPEIYLQTFQTTNTENNLCTRNGKYRDNIKLESSEEVVIDSPLNVHKERRPIFLVSIPGLNEWALNVEKQQQSQFNAEIDLNDAVANGTKRSLDEENAIEMDTNEAEAPKKMQTVEQSNQSAQAIGLSREYLLNSPITERPSKACMVKFYEDTLKMALNDVVDVVGFLSVDPSLCGSNQQPNDYENFNEICAMNPPPSLIPRIHAIAYRPLAHLNPLLLDVATTLNLNEQTKMEIYKDLRIVLTQCLFGDSVAADYLFCHLISTVYVRSEETLGQFSINLTNLPADILPDYIKQLYEIIEMLLPASHYFPVTLENLNSTEFIPTKDYETGKLTSGLLQLAPHTHLVLDETCLQAGKLETKGIESVVHISNLIRKQQLNVNFKFYTIDYNANVAVLVISEGKSMFPSNCHIPLKTDADSIRLINETFVAIRQFLKPKLDLIRNFLTIQRLQEFDMQPQNMEMIQNDFVEMRRTFNATADDLHSMLILSRMLSIIQGKSILDADSWNQAKRLEEERRKRIKELPKK